MRVPTRVVLLVSLVVCLFAATATAASALSYTWSPKGVTFGFGAPRVAYKTTTTYGQWTPVAMQCYATGDTWTDAYTSNKWFRVKVLGVVTWMHSSNVYWQTTVPRC